MDKFIQRPLTKSEINKVVEFLSYHLNYRPIVQLHMKFAKTPREFAKWYEGKPTTEPMVIDVINRHIPAFFDHPTHTAVFQGFAYVNGIAVPSFLIPMATVIHESIHFYQFVTGSYGSWKIMYEGTNELLSCFLTDDYAIDYKHEAQYAFNLIMALNDYDFWETINWIKKYTTHSDKNKFVTRSMLNCPLFSKFRPSNLLRWLDLDRLDKIKNEDTRTIFTKYSLSQIKKMLHINRQTIV